MYSCALLQSNSVNIYSRKTLATDVAEQIKLHYQAQYMFESCGFLRQLSKSKARASITALCTDFLTFEMSGFRRGVRW